MKWDILDINLPWRYFISECLQNGTLPLWNPYINCGFPQSADPMTWYPVSWFVGFFFGNSLMSIQYEYLFHIFIGAVGFYKLGGLFRFNNEAKLISSISFMFSGLFISNAQHLGWIVSAAWFPLILYHYILFSKTFKLKDGIAFALFLFFQLTGGYAGFVIITGYILFALCIYFFASYRKDKSNLKKYFLGNILIATVFILLSSVVLVASLQVSTLLTRYHQLSIDYVTMGYLPVKGLISFLLPFATTTNTGFWGMDSSLINCYIGIISFVFLVYSILVIKNVKIRILFFIGLLFLAIALAHVFPFRRWLYFLPFMNIFRFPAIFRFFAYFIFIIIIGIGINHFLKDDKNEKVLQFIIVGFIGIFGVFAIYNSFYIEKWVFKSLFIFDLKTFLSNASIHSRIFLQAFTGIIILSALLLMLRTFKGRARNILLVLWVVVDMVFATQLNIYDTVISFQSPKPTQKAINELPEGFPTPRANEKIMGINDLTAPPIPFLWRNLNIFHKKPSYTGYSPYYFSSMQKCEAEGLFHSVIKNPLFYLAGSINKNNVIDSLSIDSLSSQKIKITAFNPNQVEIKVNTEKKKLLTFVQNYFPGWKVYLNGNKTELIISNYTFMSVWVPKGEQQVVFKYEPRNVLVAFYVSAVVFIGLVLAVFIIRVKKLRVHNKL